MTADEPTRLGASPKLGWLEAFLCAADRLSFMEAGRDLSLHPSNVQKRVQKLEKWLRRPLMDDDDSQLSIDSGEEFVFIALNILNEIDGHRAKASRPLPSYSNIMLSDFENFVFVADEGSYEGASIVANRNVTTVRKSVMKLAGVLGKSLVEGPGGRGLTQNGAQFRTTAKRIIDAFYGFRAAIPNDYDPIMTKMKEIFDLNKRNMMRLSGAIGIIERTGRKQRGRVRVDELRKHLEFSTLLHTRIVNEFGSFDSISGKTILIFDPTENSRSVFDLDGDIIRKNQ